MIVDRCICQTVTRLVTYELRLVASLAVRLIGLPQDTVLKALLKAVARL